jgi:hypothetical protein
VKTPFRVDGECIVEADGNVVIDAVGTADFTVDEMRWLVDRINAPSIDELLKCDDGALMEAMSRVRPDWWLDFADDRDVRSFAKSMVEEIGLLATQGRLVQGQEARTLRRMRDVLWVMGHAHLEVPK